MNIMNMRKLAPVGMLLALIALSGIACLEFDASVFNEIEYKVEMGTNAVQISEAVKEMDLANATVSPDFDDGAWVNETKQDCQTIRELCEQARAIEPPESVQQNHEKYLEAVSHFETAADSLEKGVDEANQAKVDEAQAEIDAGVEAIQEFYQEMKDEPWVADLEKNFNIAPAS